MTSKESNNHLSQNRAQHPSPQAAPTSTSEVSPQISTTAALIKRAQHDASTLTSGEVMQLQRALGNQAVSKLLNQNVAQRKGGANNTGMPDGLKAGIEQLSGMDMSDVRVHYNSAKPAQLKALAYSQGSEIHLAPGQDQHLAHEAWHVVQQKQGRLKPNADGIAINDDPALETEADTMGAKALQTPPAS